MKVARRARTPHRPATVTLTNWVAAYRGVDVGSIFAIDLCMGMKYWLRSMPRRIFEGFVGSRDTRWHAG